MMARKLIVPPSVKPGIPRIEQFPRSWRRVPFGDLLEPAMRPVKLEASSLYQLVVAKRNRGGIAPREQLRGDQIKTAGQFVLREGDFVIAKRQIIHGACGFVPKSLDGAIVSGEYDVFRVREPLMWRFLEWFTHTTYFQQTTYQSSIGVAIEKMIFNTERWLHVLMPLPPADEQGRIARVLDGVRWQEQCSMRLIEAQRRLKAALLQRLLSNPSRGEQATQLVAFGDVVRFQEGLVDPRQEPYRDMLHVGPENLRPGGETLSGLVTAGQLGLVSGKYAFDEGAIVYSKIRPELNKVCRPGFAGVCSADAYAIWADDTVVLPDFLVEVMRSPRFMQQSIAASMRTGMPKINRADLSRIELRLPSLPDQKRVAGCFARIAQKVALLTRQLAAYRQLKRGLMQTLLTGDRSHSTSRGSTTRVYRHD